MSTMPFEQKALLTLVAGPDAVQAMLQRDLGRPLIQLPVKEGAGWLHDKDEFLKQAEALGFVIGERIDDLFIAVTPPPGWTLKHRESYHSDFLDGQGRVRGYQFYKGAFYDREAFGSFRCRYKVDQTEPADWYERMYPTRPEPLFRLEEREITLAPGEEPREDDRLLGYDWDYEVFSRTGRHMLGREDNDGYIMPRGGARKVRRKVKVFLPDDQQPKPIPAQGYEFSTDVIDTATGEIVWKGETLYHPHRGEPDYMAFITGDGYDEQGNCNNAENRARKAACAWADENLPRWRDVTAYWDEELPHGA